MTDPQQTRAELITRFGSGWLGSWDRWWLYADRLEFQQWDTGFRTRYTFQLENLNPEMEQVKRTNWKGLAPNGILTISSVVIMWLIGALLPVGLASPQHYWWEGGFLILLLMLNMIWRYRPHRCMLVLGITPAYIRYGWGQDRKARAFAQQVVEQVAKVHRANPESVAYGRGLK